MSQILGRGLGLHLLLCDMRGVRGVIPFGPPPDPAPGPPRRTPAPRSRSREIVRPSGFAVVRLITSSYFVEHEVESVFAKLVQLQIGALVVDADTCALLGCFLGWRFWLCRKLKHRCLLTLA